MVWKERSRVDERMLLIGEYLKGERAMTDLCCEFGISRKTAYKWVAPVQAGRPGGARGQVSRAAHAPSSTRPGRSARGARGETRPPALGCAQDSCVAREEAAAARHSRGEHRERHLREVRALASTAGAPKNTALHRSVQRRRRSKSVSAARAPFFRA